MRAQVLRALGKCRFRQNTIPTRPHRQSRLCECVPQVIKSNLLLSNYEYLFGVSMEKLAGDLLGGTELVYDQFSRLNRYSLKMCCLERFTIIFTRISMGFYNMATTLVKVLLLWREKSSSAEKSARNGGRDQFFLHVRTHGMFLCKMASTRSKDMQKFTPLHKLLTTAS